MKKIIPFLFCLIPMSLIAQPKNIDSLLYLLQEKKISVEQKFAVYNDVCYYYLNSDPQKALLNIQEALSFAEKEKNKKWVSVFNSYMANVHKLEGNYDMASDYYTKALDIAIAGKLEDQEAYVYLSMATLNHQQGKIINALDLLIKALSIYEKGETINHRKKEALILYNIGTMHRGLENDERAIYYLKRSEEMAEKLNDSELMMSIYYDFGNIYSGKEEYDIALDYILKSLEICRSYGDKMTECVDLGTLAVIYKNGFKDYQKAEEYANAALLIAGELNAPYLLLDAWNTLATVYFSQKRYADSEIAAMKAWEIDSTTIDLTPLITYNIGLANIYLGNNKKAVHYLDKSITISKDLSNKNFQNLILDLETKYETEKNELRITALEEEQKLFIGMGLAIMIALLLGIGLLIYHHRITVQKKKIAEQEIQQLKQEKELIATRSALDAEKAEREIIARDLHDGVGAMLSVVKNNMDIMKSYSIIENVEADYFNKALDVLNKSITELSRVAHHIMPATLIDKGLATALDDFCRSISEVEFHFTEFCQRLDPEKELVLYRCAYELINNALRHSGASHIDVHLNMNEKTVYLSVVDNGCGFDSQTASIGMGINNMRTRLSVLDGRIDIYSEQEKGTEVNIELDL